MARAITQALAVQQQHSAGATSFTTGASYTPAANALMLAHVQLGGASNSAIAPTLTGNGLTWVLKESNRSPSGDAGTVGLVYHAQGASPSNGALTLTRDSTYTWDMVLLSVDQVTEVPIGNDGADAIVAVTKSNNTGIDGSSLSSLAVSMTTGDSLHALWCKGGYDNDATPKSGWTQLAVSNDTGFERTIESQYKIGTDTSSEITWQDASGYAFAIVIEIATIAAAFDQTANRWYADDAAPGSATALAGENAPPTLAVGTPARVRVQVDAAGDTPAILAQLEYRKAGSATGIWHTLGVD